MPDVVSNDELNALAAEYVLGTLDYEERKGANALLEVDPTFRGIVRIWERRFGELHLMVEPVEPDPQLWARASSRRWRASSRSRRRYRRMPTSPRRGGCGRRRPSGRRRRHRVGAEPPAAGRSRAPEGDRRGT